MASRLCSRSIRGTVSLAFVVSASLLSRRAEAQPERPAAAPAAAPAAPARPDAPPPPPAPPWTANPAVVPAPPTPAAPPAPAAPPPPPPPPPASPEQVTEHDKHVSEIELRLIQQEERLRREREDHERWWGWTRWVTLSGYIQPQLLWQWYDNAAASPNPAGQSPNAVVAKPDTVWGAGAPGLTTNGDYFRLRRARLKVELMPNEASRFVMEIDPVLAGGPDNATGTIARNVEAQGIAKWSNDVVTTFGVGIFKIPYGWEVLQSDADRPFIERSWWEQNITPGEFDTGAKAYTSAFQKRLTFQAAVVNGEIQGEKTFSLLPDLKQGKDVLGRINYNFGPIDLGMSGYYGQGIEVVIASLAAKNYPRYMGNVEGALHHKIADIGETRLFAEINAGQNMDRGTKYPFALPGLPSNVVSGSVTNRNEFGWFARIEQDITRWTTLAFRYDFYTPDTSIGTNGRSTEAVAGVAHFTKQLQMMLEYNHYTDNAHSTAVGTAIPYKQGNVFSGVLQVRYP